MQAAGESSRVAVVTGVSRREGIGFAIARRLLDEGWKVLIHSFAARDAEHAWGGDPGGVTAVLEDLGGVSDRLRHVVADLGDPEAPAALVGTAVDAFGAVDALVVNHAHGSNLSLESVTAAELDRAWQVNARAAVLLAQAFAASHADDRPDGRIVFFVSGQHLAAMPNELPYVVSKGAVHQMTRTISDELADRGVTVNAVNPGPVDTGWPSADLRDRLRARFPAGRWGLPEDVAAVVSWLLSPESGWVTGQVIDAEGGFRRR